MLAYTYISPSKFELIDKPKPELQSPRDAIVRITLGSICERLDKSRCHPASKTASA